VQNVFIEVTFTLETTCTLEYLAMLSSDWSGQTQSNKNAFMVVML